ncbi:uncharacterized protein LOC106433258 [Brassica napus]|uniref:uncharacterized protein LOC106433258 n=1 Tax=Brassica napus TaxID=3708 RepID=UPI0006AA61CC|nr:uncharacterized protein LOC106433258 [Brassica napus]
MSDSLYSNFYRVLNLNYEHAKEEAHDQLGPWLLWRIWKNRNEFLYKGKDYDAPSTVRKAREDMEEWRSRKKAEVSEVSRDHNGNLLWTCARELPTLGSQIEVEAEAIRWAVRILGGFSYQHVIVETDSLELTKMINGIEAPWPKLRPIIQDISNLLATKKAYRVEFFPRSGNKVADRIANESLTFMSHIPKLYSIMPVWLSSLLEAEKPL